MDLMEKTSHTFFSFGNSKRPVAKSPEKSRKKGPPFRPPSAARLVVSNLEKHVDFCWTVGLVCELCFFVEGITRIFSLGLLGSKPFTKHVPELMLS